MTALSADRQTTRKDMGAGGIKSYPAGVDVIYQGGMVGIPSDGYVEAMVVGTCLRFAGVAVEKVDNSGGSNGDLDVRVYTKGVYKFAASSITQAMVGKMMYAVDDQTFDDDPGVYGVPVGILVEYVSTTEGWIDIEPACGVETRKISVRPQNCGGDAEGVEAAGGLTFTLNLTAKVAYVPINGLEVGDRITTIEYAGGIGAGTGKATTVDVDLYKSVGKAGGSTQTQIQSCTQLSKEADYAMDESVAVATPEVVVADTSYYFIVTVTTANDAACDVALTNLGLVVERQRG